MIRFTPLNGTVFTCLAFTHCAVQRFGSAGTDTEGAPK